MMLAGSLGSRTAAPCGVRASASGDAAGRPKPAAPAGPPISQITHQQAQPLGWVPRRAVVIGGLASWATMQDLPAHARIIDEAVSQRVFEGATSSVAALMLYEKKGDQLEPAGVGSGFVWDEYGHIVTNYHCIQKAVSGKNPLVLRVVVPGRDGEMREYEPTVAGVDPAHDLAVLTVEAPAGSLAAVKVASSGDLKVGQSVYAIGNPSGLSHTLTVGVISGLKRSIPSPSGTAISNSIQTDAAINAGNSGGPLLDSFGRVIGVSTASFTTRGSGRSSGVNFAVDINTVRAVVPQLIVFGTVKRAV